MYDEHPVLFKWESPPGKGAVKWLDMVKEIHLNSNVIPLTVFKG